MSTTSTVGPFGPDVFKSKVFSFDTRGVVVGYVQSTYLKDTAGNYVMDPTSKLGKPYIVPVGYNPADTINRFSDIAISVFDNPVSAIVSPGLVAINVTSAGAALLGYMPNGPLDLQRNFNGQNFGGFVEDYRAAASLDFALGSRSVGFTEISSLAGAAAVNRLSAGKNYMQDLLIRPTKPVDTSGFLGNNPQNETNIINGSRLYDENVFASSSQTVPPNVDPSAAIIAAATSSFSGNNNPTYLVSGTSTTPLVLNDANLVCTSDSQVTVNGNGNTIVAGTNDRLQISGQDNSVGFLDGANTSGVPTLSNGNDLYHSLGIDNVLNLASGNAAISETNSNNWAVVQGTATNPDGTLNTSAPGNLVTANVEPVAGQSVSDALNAVLAIDGITSTQGLNVNDHWTMMDGVSGADSINANGSSSGTTTNSDGSSSSYTNDGNGDTVNTNYDTLGNETGDSWQNSDGSHGSDIFNLSNGSETSNAYASDGSGVTTQTDSRGIEQLTYVDSAGQPEASIEQSGVGADAVNATLYGSNGYTVLSSSFADYGSYLNTRINSSLLITGFSAR